ncbi:hypothetical protein PLICRDRAFT_124521 [Plicaturopsis crispa FD-325 SS-3]|nr:hypothetical protein PLICRDRAFT_124521 [Plicaturopsis crispa FD-325 SS-3]
MSTGCLPVPGCPPRPHHRASSVPQKRRAPVDEQESPSRKFATGSATMPEITEGEYKTGRVICQVCGDAILFRDDATGVFTVKHWDSHRERCHKSTLQPDGHSNVISTPESTAQALAHPPIKRRRAKRTEEERIEYLRSDPYIADFEAYRVLCSSCDRWIRLRPNSTYCSIPWDAHRKSCLARKLKMGALDERNTLFAMDPDVRKFDSERVLCNNCHEWITISGADDVGDGIRKWRAHRASCRKTPAPATSSRTAKARPTSSSSSTTPSRFYGPAHEEPQPSPSQPRTLSSLSLPPPPRMRPASPHSLSISASTPEYPHPPGFSSHSRIKDFTPANYPGHESRRRNAEQRAAILHDDELVGAVEPNRVFCSLCRKWVQLRQDSSYCAYPWLQHRGKCLMRHQRRVHKAAQVTRWKLSKGTGHGSSHARRPSPSDDEEEYELDSDDNMDGRSRRRAGPSNSSSQGGDSDISSEDDTRSQSSPSVSSHTLADLDSRRGREDFILTSLDHLFTTTYEGTDEMTISSLLTYVNAAMPPDKHEDFDTAEVVRAAATLKARGILAFEGDTLRLLD